MKTICVVTGSRAEYGLLKLLIDNLKKSKKLKTKLLVTGSHLSSNFGKTINAIKKDGFKIDHIVNMNIKNDTPKVIINSISVCMNRITLAIKKINPDMILILGDRYEIFAVAIAAMFNRIPIAHLHGGELTEGSFDDSIRHSITKMSHLHFVANNNYRRRVLQLGEQPNRVFNVGGLGVDCISKLKLFTKEELETELNYKFLDKNLLITFHPVSLEPGSAKNQINKLLNSLSNLKKIGLIFTMPNADTENKIIFKKIKIFCKKNINAKYYKSLGQKLYLSCVKHTDGVIGNSSSGLLEVPSFKKGTVNIGDRQRGRLQAKSIINCTSETKSISKAIKYLFSKEFQHNLKKIKNPYGSAGASKKIVKIIERNVNKNLLKKSFYDLKV